MKHILNILFFIFVAEVTLYSQSLELPRVSSKAMFRQNVGLSFVEIQYSRPGVKGREIWGKLVPYNNGNPFPWRAGANENTTIEISDDSKINGKSISAGLYGFHIIPSEKEWILIFNKKNKSWGSFFYDSTYDALRIKVKPSENEFTEWLEYGVSNLTDSSVVVFMKWEKIKIEFNIAFSEKDVVLKKIREQLSSLAGFGWEGLMEAAKYCLENNFNYDEALKWIELSIDRTANFQNEIIKIELLEKMGNVKESAELKNDLFKNSTEKELNLYAYKLLNENKVDDALIIFKQNVERFNDSWNSYDSYAEALVKKGKISEAKNNFKKALDLAPDNQKERIKNIIEKL